MTRLLTIMLMAFAMLRLTAQTSQELPAQSASTSLTDSISTLLTWKARLDAIRILPDDPIERLLTLNEIEQGRGVYDRFTGRFKQASPPASDKQALYDAWVSLGQSLQRLDNLQKSSTWTLHEAYHRRATRFLNTGDSLNARVALRRALDANPAYAPSASAMIRLLLDARETGAAVQSGLAFSRSTKETNARDSLLAMLSPYMQAVRAWQLTEAHTQALGYIDSLLVVYRWEPAAQNLLHDLEDLSRTAILQAYLDVAETSVKSGNPRLARHYRELASVQAEAWSLKLPEAPTQAAALAQRPAQTLPIAKQPYTAMEPRPTSRPTLTSPPSTKQQDRENELLMSLSETRLQAWQGDSMAVAAYLARIDACLEDDQGSEALADARELISQEWQHYLCRQRAGRAEALLYASEKYAKAGNWRQALDAFQQARQTSQDHNACTHHFPVPLVVPTLYINAAAYEDMIAQSYLALEEGDYYRSDSILLSANNLHHRNIGPERGPAMVDFGTMIQHLPYPSYLLHRSRVAMQADHLPEALAYLEQYRLADGDAATASSVQQELGQKLAAHDLRTSHLRNPKTLLAGHVPMNAWYRPLIRAYQQRFRKG